MLNSIPQELRESEDVLSNISNAGTGTLGVQ